MREGSPPVARALGLVGAVVLSASVLACRGVPPPVQRQVPTAAPAPAKVVWNGRYAEHVQPTFNRYCVACHGADRAENGLDLSNYEGVMKGTRFGPVVAPGVAAGSTLLSVLRGGVGPAIRMPHGGERPAEQEIQNLQMWIAAGAPPD